MADNPPPSTPPPAPNPGLRPTLPGSTATGRLKVQTTQLPTKKGNAGKIVVMLSSVAKPPPMGTQALPRVTPVVEPTAKPVAPPVTAPVVNRPPPLPPAQVVPANNLPSPSRPQLSATTYVKLPPKTTVPGWSSLSGKPVATPTPVPPVKAMEPIRHEPKKPGAQHIPPIKLNEPVAAADDTGGDSIFLQKQPEPPKPEAAKTPAPITPSVPAALVPPAALAKPATPVAPPTPIEAKTPPGSPVSLDLFERSQAPSPKPTSAPVPEAKTAVAPLIAPPLLPPQKTAPPPVTPGGLSPVRPPPLPPTLTRPMERLVTPPPTEKPLPTPPAKSAGVTLTPPAALKVAPPIVEKAPAPVAEKLLPPPLAKPVEAPPALHVAPPMLEKPPEPPAEKLLPQPVTKPAESPVTPPPALHVAPPMLEKAPEPVAEKLPPPHFPVEPRKGEAAPAARPSPSSQKSSAPGKAEAASPKPSQPPKLPLGKTITGWLKKTPPLVLSSSAPKPTPPLPIVEAKPALKPAVLPARSMLVPTPVAEPPAPPPAEKPKVIEKGKEPKAPEKKEVPTPVPATPATLPPAIAPAVVAAGAATTAAIAIEKAKSEKAKPEAKLPPAKPAREIPEPPKTKVPPTRAERAKKRRFMGTLFFWLLLFPGTVALLFWASLHFGRDTRVEGQIIPPPGMMLNNEVWIVTDFRSLASGITEDLAQERTPLMLEIQERQDHVQRAQADVASREERIRLIQEEIAAAKSEIDNVVKQARDATQKVWDVDGAAVDDEYTSRLNQLQKTIVDRAKSLNLKYQADDTYHSPEVWANAYRLALYEVPAGVDGVKEHAWLSEQMKTWRDFQKSMDDRKEQLREKAAQIKLGPAPKITSLNAKIDELQQRIDATVTEEVPLKAELLQAQADLTAAQAADAGLDDKYYKQLYSLPGEAVTKHIALQTNGRFTWLEDDIFVEGEKEHHYWIFARATRPDGRQYWALQHFGIGKNETREMYIEPSSFISTKAILRPNLSPEEQAQ